MLLDIFAYTDRIFAEKWQPKRDLVLGMALMPAVYNLLTDINIAAGQIDASKICPRNKVDQSWLDDSFLSIR